MTYREQIQRLIEVLDLAYDLAGGIRDEASESEKGALNTTRKCTGEAASALRSLDNRLDNSRASMECGDGVEKYIVKKLKI